MKPSRPLFERDGVDRDTRRKIRELEQNSPAISKALDLLHAAAEKEQRIHARLEHIIDPAYSLLNTHDETLVSAMLLRQIPQKLLKKILKERGEKPSQDENEEKLPQALADAFKITKAYNETWQEMCRLQKRDFDHSATITPELADLLNAGIKKERRIIPLLVADYYQHLKEAASIEPGKSGEIARTRIGLARNGLHFWSRLAHAANWGMAVGIEDNAFKILNPQDYQKIHDAFPKHSMDMLKNLENRIRSALEENKIIARVQARRKGLYSTFKAIRTKKVNSPRDINDLYGIRVIPSANNLENLYLIRALVRQELQRILVRREDREKDMVAEPPERGYQALHDGYFLPRKFRYPAQSVEIQYRTPSMHWLAEVQLPHHEYKPPRTTNPELESKVKDLLTNAHKLYQGYEISRLRKLLGRPSKVVK